MATSVTLSTELFSSNESTAAASFPAPKLPGSGTRFAPNERVQFTSQLAMMTGAGVAVSSALKSLVQQFQRPAVRSALEEINEDVLGGSSFSSALRKHPGMFDEAYIATITAGESSGKMSEILTQLAELLRSELRLRRTIRGMMIYPALLTVVSLSVVSILIVFVLPQFSSIFDQYDLALPLITRILLAVGDEIRGRWWLWGPLAGCGMAAIVAAKVTPAGRRFVDTLLLRTPKLNELVRLLIGARVCQLMGLLLSAGVPLLDCLGLLRHAVQNSLFKDLSLELEEAVTNGRSLSDAMKGNIVLPASATEMIATAEKTGKLGEVTLMMGVHYEEEGQASAQQLLSAIEPFMTIIMGAVIAIVVLAVMLPVFDIATIAQQ